MNVQRTAKTMDGGSGAKMGGWQRWLIAVVLKTINGKTFGGSNPSPSAEIFSFNIGT